MAKKVELKKRQILDKIKSIGLDICKQIDNGRFPLIEIPSRSSANIVYDEAIRQYVLGPKRIRRYSKNVRHVRKFSQLVWLGYFIKQLMLSNKSSTLRDVYYSAEAYGIYFKSQQESNEIIADMEALLDTAREEFHIFPEERSAIFGELLVEYTCPGYEGKRVWLDSHPSGIMIGPSLVSAEFVECNAERVIVIESGGMFDRFIEEQVHKRYKAILIHTGGQAPRSTRWLIRRLNKELSLPVYIFTDGDPWGMHIAMVIISGSAHAAHIKDLATPDAKWIGVWPDDIIKYKLPTDKMNDQDIKRLKELEKDVRYQTKFWQDKVKLFLKLRKKAEQQAFSRYGLTYVVDKYLPDKLSEIEG